MKNQRVCKYCGHEVKEFSGGSYPNYIHVNNKHMCNSKKDERGILNTRVLSKSETTTK
jgi:hypothetical protein